MARAMTGVTAALSMLARIVMLAVPSVVIVSHGSYDALVLHRRCLLRQVRLARLVVLPVWPRHRVAHVPAGLHRAAGIAPWAVATSPGWWLDCRRRVCLFVTSGPGRPSFRRMTSGGLPAGGKRLRQWPGGIGPMTPIPPCIGPRVACEPPLATRAPGGSHQMQGNPAAYLRLPTGPPVSGTMHSVGRAKTRRPGR
jgi:hypothetical protein